MAQATLTSSPALTIADLLRQLGDIPPHRVRLRPALGMATEADVIEIEAKENRLFELVDGVLVEKAMGIFESCLTVELSTQIQIHVKKHRLGFVAGADGMFRLAPGLVRIPDISFVSWSRVPGGVVPTEPIPSLAPDLAVEVLSASNTEREMERKRDEYFQAGVLEVWLVDPRSRTIRIYKPGDVLETFGEADTIDGGDILPGLTLAVKDLFTMPAANSGGPEAQAGPAGA